MAKAAKQYKVAIVLGFDRYAVSETKHKTRAAALKALKWHQKRRRGLVLTVVAV